MIRSTTLLLASLCMTLCVTSLEAQNPFEQDNRGDQARGAQQNKPSVEQMRAAVLQQMLREFGQNRRVEIEQKVRAMSPQRVGQLFGVYQRRAAEMARQGSLEQRSAYGRRPVGYAPVVTWLPSGASMGASAVVSPDRRYVRVNAQPFFSQVGPVNTFTYQNPGAYRYPYPYPQQYAYPQYQQYRPQYPVYRSTPRRPALPYSQAVQPKPANATPKYRFRGTYSEKRKVPKD